MKKAQGLSLNTIIVAAIVLIVLVVLIMVFTGRMQIFGIGLHNQTQSGCNSLGGDCVPREDCKVGDIIYRATDCGSGKICCES